MASGVGAAYSYLNNGFYPTPLWTLLIPIGLGFVMWLGRNL